MSTDLNVQSLSDRSRPLSVNSKPFIPVGKQVSSVPPTDIPSINPEPLSFSAITMLSKEGVIPKKTTLKVSAPVKVVSKSDPNKCKTCDRNRIKDEDFCFDCYHRQGKKCENFDTCGGYFGVGNTLCRTCLVKCPTEGCPNERYQNWKGKLFPTCKDCYVKCSTVGCYNERSLVEGSKTAYHKVCVDCFSVCRTEGCPNKRSKSKNGFLHPTCKDCYVKEHVLCECGKRRGFDKDGYRYRYCFDCSQIDE